MPFDEGSILSPKCKKNSAIPRKEFTLCSVPVRIAARCPALGWHPAPVRVRRIAGIASPCAISREALESAGGGHTARRWQLLEAFERLRPRIERIALAKARATPEKSIGMMTTISTDELND